jgi:hypothetical protein
MYAQRKTVLDESLLDAARPVSFRLICPAEWFPQYTRDANRC